MSPKPTFDLRPCSEARPILWRAFCLIMNRDPSEGSPIWTVYDCKCVVRKYVEKRKQHV